MVVVMENNPLKNKLLVSNQLICYWEQFKREIKTKFWGVFFFFFPRQQYCFTVTYITLAKIAYNSYFPHILIHSWVFEISFLHCFSKALKNKTTAIIPVQKGKCSFFKQISINKSVSPIWQVMYLIHSRKQWLRASCLLLALLNRTHFLLPSKGHTGSNSPLQILCCHRRHCKTMHCKTFAWFQNTAVGKPGLLIVLVLRVKIS